MSRNSSIFVGRVSHRRKAPFQHKLRYRTYSLLMDLDELDDVIASNRLLSHNRWNLFSINDRDHGPRDGTGMRDWFDAQLSAAGIDPSGGRVEVLLFPRLLGYAFNPLTTWFSYSADGSLQAVLYEIHNTFGHSHSHLVPVTGSAPYRHAFAKQLHVSPFFDQDGLYSFTLRPPTDRFSVSIHYRTADTDLLTATMVGTKRPLTAGQLLRVFATHPLLTFKVTLGIHWNALRILLKGGRYRSIPEPPTAAVTAESTFVGTS